MRPQLKFSSTGPHPPEAAEDLLVSQLAAHRKEANIDVQPNCGQWVPLGQKGGT